MKNKVSFRHGEVILTPVELPKEAHVVEKSKKYIVAHSETGHHHVLEAQKQFTVFSWNGERYIEIPEFATLLHEKTGTEIHTPHIIPSGVYKINIKKHFDYAAKKMAQVRD